MCEDNSYLQIDINQEIEHPKTSGTVTTKYYLYSVADAEGKDLVGFHFHPDLTEDPILYPHIHAYANQDPRYLSLNLHRKHIPSGRVAPGRCCPLANFRIERKAAAERFGRGSH